VRQLQREYGMDEFICYFNQGGLMDHAMVRQSMTALSRKVMPHFRWKGVDKQKCPMEIAGVVMIVEQIGPETPAVISISGGLQGKPAKRWRSSPPSITRNVSPGQGKAVDDHPGASTPTKPRPTGGNDQVLPRRVPNCWRMPVREQDFGIDRGLARGRCDQGGKTVEWKAPTTPGHTMSHISVVRSRCSAQFASAKCVVQSLGGPLPCVATGVCNTFAANSANIRDDNADMAHRVAGGVEAFQFDCLADLIASPARQTAVNAGNLAPGTGMRQQLARVPAYLVVAAGVARCSVGLSTW